MINFQDDEIGQFLSIVGVLVSDVEIRECFIVCVFKEQGLF